MSSCCHFLLVLLLLVLELVLMLLLVLVPKLVLLLVRVMLIRLRAVLYASVWQRRAGVMNLRTNCLEMMVTLLWRREPLRMVASRRYP